MLFRIKSLVLLGFLALTACGGSEESTTVLTTTGVISPSPTPSPSQPRPTSTPSPPSQSPSPIVRSSPTPTPSPIVRSSPTPTPTAKPTASPIPSPSPSLSSTADQVILLTNQNRVAQGLSPLEQSAQLQKAAQDHANDMAKQNYFSHIGINGSTLASRVSATGYPWSALGENIARGQSEATTVVTGWMQSPGHRGNILDPSFREMGVGYAQGSSGPYWVQVFGSSR